MGDRYDKMHHVYKACERAYGEARDEFKNKYDKIVFDMVDKALIQVGENKSKGFIDFSYDADSDPNSNEYLSRKFQSIMQSAGFKTKVDIVPSIVRISWNQYG